MQYGSGAFCHPERSEGSARSRLAVPLIDRGADLVEGFPCLVKTKGESPLALADVARARHAGALVAAQERVVAFDLSAAALTANPIDDLWNLAHLVESDAGAGRVNEVSWAENV